jgi:hypothetical protein
MSEYFPCPWCGAQPEEYSKWEEDGFSQKRFGCKNPDCPIRPFIDIGHFGVTNGIERWQKMETVLKLRQELARCEGHQEREDKRGWPHEDPKAP